MLLIFTPKIWGGPKKSGEEAGGVMGLTSPCLHF